MPEGIAINTALGALCGKPASAYAVVREKREATKRALASADRNAEKAIKKAADLRTRNKIEEEAEKQYLEELEHNPNALPDPCLAPDRDFLDAQIEARKQQARAAWFSLYAVYVLWFDSLDGHYEYNDFLGTAKERKALMSSLARLGYQIVDVNAARGEVVIRRCHDGECKTGDLLQDLTPNENGEAADFNLPPQIMQSIKEWAAVRLDVEFGFRPDGTYGQIGTNNEVTPMLPYFPIRFQRPELWFDFEYADEESFYDYPAAFYNYVFPRHPP